MFIFWQGLGQLSVIYINKFKGLIWHVFCLFVMHNPYLWTLLSVPRFDIWQPINSDEVTRAARKRKMYLINMDNLAERCDEDDRFCVVCLRARTDRAGYRLLLLSVRWQGRSFSVKNLEAPYFRENIEIINCVVAESSLPHSYSDKTRFRYILGSHGILVSILQKEKLWWLVMTYLEITLQFAESRKRQIFWL